MTPVLEALKSLLVLPDPTLSFGLSGDLTWYLDGEHPAVLQKTFQVSVWSAIADVRVEYQLQGTWLEGPQTGETWYEEITTDGTLAYPTYRLLEVDSDVRLLTAAGRDMFLAGGYALGEEDVSDELADGDSSVSYPDIDTASLAENMAFAFGHPNKTLIGYSGLPNQYRIQYDWHYTGTSYLQTVGGLGVDRQDQCYISSASKGISSTSDLAGLYYLCIHKMASRSFYWHEAWPGQEGEVYEPNEVVVDDYLVYEVTIIGAPEKVTNIEPANSYSDFLVPQQWGWGKGTNPYRQPTGFRIYAGDDPDNLSLLATVSDLFYDMSNWTLPDLNVPLYWRVDAFNLSGTTTGDVWSFTVEREEWPPGPQPPEPEGCPIGTTLNPATGLCDGGNFPPWHPEARGGGRYRNNILVFTVSDAGEGKILYG